MNKMYQYKDLIKKSTPYAKNMTRLRNQIFGEVVRDTNSKSMKVVKMYSEEPYHKRESIIDYYPRHIETNILMRELRTYGLFRDEHQDFKEEMERLRILRGKKPRSYFIKK